MALALYMVITPYALTVPSGDITGVYPANMVVQPKNVFVGDAADTTLLSLVSAGALTSSAPGSTTPSKFATQVMTQ